MIFLSTYPLEDPVMASVRLHPLLKYLSRQNRHVTCILPEGPPTGLGHLPGITIRTLKGVAKWSYVYRAAMEIRKLARETPIDTVIASIPGIQSLLAAVLARHLIPSTFKLVLEVRDPFSLNPALPWSPLKRAVGKLLESVLLREPDQVIFLTSVIQSMYLTGFPGSQSWKDRNAVITNGYDAPPSESPARKDSSNRFTMTYIGQFYDRRHPLEFLKALRDYLESHPDASLPHVQMVGQVHGVDLQRQVHTVCADPLLQKCVQWMGSVPHNQALQLMQTSDINLLITHERGSEYAIPGKLFEYMGARRPVLALTRDPLVKQLMNETHMGWICEDRAEIMQWLASYLSNVQSLQNWQPNDRVLANYRLEMIHPKWLNFVENRSI